MALQEEVLSSNDYCLRLTTPFDYYFVLLNELPKFGQFMTAIDFGIEIGMTMWNSNTFRA